jgi:hypothetical protein
VRICFEWSREELRQSAPKPKKLSAKKKKKKKSRDEPVQLEVARRA